ncbi:MAG: PPC domain-containing protein [Pirellulaceae bacterium]|nr:PPC domain-containing protein [Pirellulaceae bacterium]
MQKINRPIATFAFLLALATIAHAELPSPRFDRINPLGGAAGTTIEVQLSGSDIDEPRLVFDHPGITARPVEGKEKDKRFAVKIAADVPAGTYDARVAGKWGLSNPRLFAVSHGLADIEEKETNNDIGTAQPINVNSAINGQSDGNDQDVFRVSLKKGDRVTLDCQSARLDVQLDAVMLLLAADGKQLASSADYYGRDPFIDFLAPADGDYLVVIHDLSYRGGLPYRLVVSNRPHVESAFPRAIQVGQSAEIAIFGRNLGNSPLAGGKLASGWPFDLPIQEAKLSLSPPADAALGAYRFLEHPTGHSGAPTAATCTLTGFQFRPDVGGQPLNAMTMLLAGSPVTTESEPNDTIETPQPLEFPAMVSGRFDQPRDADWYEFTVPENGQYALDVYCERIAGQADPYVVFVDEKGNRFQELDDFGHRMNAFDGHLRDPSGMINLNAKQKYHLLVQDRYRRGGPRYQYVLSLKKPEPDFFVAAIHSQNPGPGGLTLRAGSAAHFDLVIHQSNGYKAPLTITAENLPPGVHAQPTTTQNSNQGAFVLWADDDAPPFDGAIKLIATGERDGRKIVREVRPYSRVWSDNPASSRPMRQHWISVRERAPFALRFTSETLPIEAGQKAEVKLQLRRLWPEFTGQLSLLPLALPNAIKANLPAYPPGVEEATVTFEAQANAAPGEYTVHVLGQAQVLFAKEAGKDKANTLVTLPSRPITIVVTPKPGK